MISFTEYVKLNQNKAYNHTPVVVPEVKVKQVVKQIVAPAPVKEKDHYMDSTRYFVRTNHLARHQSTYIPIFS